MSYLKSCNIVTSIDKDVKDLLVFSASSDLPKHSLYKNGDIILQDKVGIH